MRSLYTIWPPELEKPNPLKSREWALVKKEAYFKEDAVFDAEKTSSLLYLFRKPKTLYALKNFLVHNSLNSLTHLTTYLHKTI